VKKFPWLKNLDYRAVAGILLGVVIIQTFFLVKTQLQAEKKKAIPPAKVSIEKIKEPPKPTAKIVTPLPKPQPRQVSPAQVSPARSSRGKIAVIVDDSGYNNRDCHYLKEIPYPVTVSILPDLTYSREIAQCAHDAQKEVMLHLPLESYESHEEYPKNYIITIDMPKGLIIDRLEESLRSVPYASGLNNHMGSKATENQRMMKILFTQLQGKNLFFVDSKVTSKSVAPKFARRAKLPFAERDVFLDNVNERSAIEAQFQELAQIAERHGSAIAIGHARTLTWEIIKEQAEKLTREGFEFVPVKTIINENK